MVCTSAPSSWVRACIILLLALVLRSCLYGLAAPPTKGQIGVDYGLNGDDLLLPQQAVQLISSNGIRRVRLYEAKPDVLRAFANAGIDLTVGVPNEDVPKVAATSTEALNWITKYIFPFPTSGISAIIVGNEWLSNSSNDPSLLVPAMQNIYNALIHLSSPYLCRIKVSTSHSLDVLSTPSFPPSIATFREGVLAVMRPLIAFLVKTNSFFMVNIMPYYAYLNDRGVSKEFALFLPTNPVRDKNTGLNYTNLFDAQLDAVYAAIASLLSSSPSLPCPSNIGKTSIEHVHLDDVRQKSSLKSRTINVKGGEAGWPNGSGGTHTNPGGVKHRFGRQSINALPLTHTSSSPLYAHAHHNPLYHHAILQNTTLARNFTLPSTTPSPSLFSSILVSQLDLSAHIAASNSTHAYVTIPSSSKVGSSVTSSSPISSLSTMSTPSLLTSSATSTSLAHIPNSSNTNEYSSRLSILSNASISHIQSQYILSRAQYTINAQDDMIQQCICDADDRSLENVATIENARTFNQNLIRHVLQAKGTPAHPDTPIEVYIFELFNEDLKPPGPEQHFGLFYPNGTAVYPINFNDRGK